MPTSDSTVMLLIPTDLLMLALPQRGRIACATVDQSRLADAVREKLRVKTARRPSFDVYQPLHRRPAAGCFTGKTLTRRRYVLDRVLSAVWRMSPRRG